MTTIAVCIPTRGLLHAGTVTSLQEAIAHLRDARPDVEVPPKWNIVSGLPIPDSHNTAAEMGLATGAELLLWVEEDNLIPETALVEMLSLVEHNADWAFVDYPVTASQRGSDGQEMCFHYSLVERRVLWTGLGCTLIRQRIFTELVEPPWFRTDTVLRVSNWGTAREEVRPVAREFRGLGGQDISFGWRATRAGARIEVVRGITGGQFRLTKRGAEGTNNGAHEYTLWR